MNYRYLSVRLFQFVFTLWVATTLTFFLIRILPGGPFQYIYQQLLEEAMESGENPDEAIEQARLMEEYLGFGTNKPMYLQYIEYLQSLLTGHMGTSFWFDRPVVDILLNALPWTVFLMVASSLFTFITGILLGALMAYFQGGKFDSTMTTLQIVMSGIPYYVYAIFLISIVAFQWELLPRGGQVAHDVTPGYNLDYIISITKHAILPILSMLIAGFGGPALTMRANSIQVLGSDYLRNAELRGISTGRLVTRYVTPNAILPLYTGFMIGIAGFFSGAVILETIFAYPGMGWYTLQAFVTRDYPLMMGGFMLLTSLTLLGLVLADLTYGLIDPRIKTGETHESF